MVTTLNQELWDKILNFDFDDPESEYSFSTRLASENYWPQSFTKQAIIEYKKFMYLAATSDLMVSPSHIVDTVWHQHLIFTQSYQQFCEILGKTIQHIPSTHHSADGDKFEQAKQRTIGLYNQFFGQQPENIWTYHDLLDSLNLKMSRFKVRSVIIIGLLAFICGSVPAYLLLKPIYVQIGNPEFFTGLHLLVLSAFLILELYNRLRLKNMIATSDKSSFVYDLQPLELIYAKTQDVDDTINSVVNELIENGAIQVNTDHTLELLESKVPVTDEQRQIFKTLKELGVTSYPTLLQKLAAKPIFLNTVSFVSVFREYVNKSEKFASLFCVNFFTLWVLFMLTLTRLATGTLNGKPVMVILFVTIALFAMIVFFLLRLTKQVTKSTIPNLYKNEILPVRSFETNGQWGYFLFGSAIYTSSFAPLANQPNRNSLGDGSSSTCGSSCGSSCNSCGGCGSD